MPPPRVAPKEESFGFFGQVGLGLSYLSENTPRPGKNGKGCDLASGNGCASEDRNSLLFNALAGVRIRNSDTFFFFAYYKYSMFWDVVSAKAGSLGNWFSSPSNPQSPIPTRGLLRVHELATDARYLAADSFRFGLQIQLSLGRLNSSLFAQESELTGTSFVSEAFVPYAIFIAGRYYRARLYLPIYTVVNDEDRDLTYTTFDFGSTGRGPVFSVGLSNLFYVPPADSIVAWDLSFLESKYYSVSNDRTRVGSSLAWNWSPPFAPGATVAPKASYVQDAFYLPRPSIPGYDPDPPLEAPPNVNLAVRAKRVDTSTRMGALVALDVEPILGALGIGKGNTAPRHRVSFEGFYDMRSSTLPDYPARTTFLVMRYQWTAPSIPEVGRFLRNTERNPVNGSFEGDGGF